MQNTRINRLVEINRYTNGQTHNCVKMRTHGIKIFNEIMPRQRDTTDYLHRQQQLIEK